MKHLRSLDARALTVTLGIGIPLAILSLFSNYLLWMATGYPFGYVPALNLLPPTTILIWRFLGVVKYAIYLLFGVIYVWLLRPKKTVGNREAIVHGALIGALTSFVRNIGRGIMEWPSLIAYTDLEVDLNPSSTYSQYIIEGTIGLLVGLLFVMIAAIILAAFGAWLTMKLSHKRK